MKDNDVQIGRPLVLIADDDENIRLLARTCLERSGFDVVEAEDGTRALSVFEQFRPDVVLLDVVMPEMDGFSVCTALRKLPGSEHTPILLTTGLEDIESINRAYHTGATDFVTKPINWIILGHRVRYMWRASLSNEKLRQSEEKNSALINAIPDLMFQVAEDGTILDFKWPKGYASLPIHGDLPGRNIDEVFPLKAGRPFTSCIQKALRNGEIQICDHETQSGQMRYYESRIVESGKKEVLVIVRDITDRKNAEAKITELAYYDTLTGLLNRHSLKEHLDHALARARRHDRLVAVIFLDLDRFKHINDTLGHNLGDLLLQGVSDRLVNCVRTSDLIARAAKGNSIARLGGDEFVVLLAEINQPQDAGKVARRILDTLSCPFVLAGQEIYVNASIGISVFPFDGEDSNTLLKNADTAMYHAKDQGRGNHQFYTESMNVANIDRLSMEHDLRRALDRGEFLLYYQPQVSLQTGRIIGAEALIRWQHPDRGLVPPLKFIPLAEETGLIIPIGEWVLRTACAQIKAWSDMGLGELRVAVNVSSIQFRQRNFTETVGNCLERSGLEAQHLEIELTESAIMQNPDAATIMLQRLKAMGVRLAIDDFGTGYSSLSYLKRFPLDVVKIDRSFIKDITTDSDDAAITVAIIALAHTLKLDATAEGVETQDQLEFLREKECDLVQGYLFSPPVPADVYTSILREGRCLYGLSHSMVSPCSNLMSSASQLIAL